MSVKDKLENDQYDYIYNLVTFWLAYDHNSYLICQNSRSIIIIILFNGFMSYKYI